MSPIKRGQWGFFNADPSETDVKTPSGTSLQRLQRAVEQRMDVYKVSHDTLTIEINVRDALWLITQARATAPGKKEEMPVENELPIELKFARFYATAKHGEQKYMEMPYVVHLMAVEAVARRFGLVTAEFLAACWLHDVVEDTDVKARDIREQFGPEIAYLVAAVTSEPGEDRRTRNALTYPKIFKAGAEAVALKLCDRIANVSNGGDAAQMYTREHYDFKRALYTAGSNEDLWKELERILPEGHL